MVGARGIARFNDGGTVVGINGIERLGNGDMEKDTDSERKQTVKWSVVLSCNMRYKPFIVIKSALG